MAEMEKKTYYRPLCDVCILGTSGSVLTTIDFNSVDKTSGGTLNANDMLWEEDDPLMDVVINVWDE